jgi:hypothetical protein
MSHEGQRQSVVITLGISAIDVLSCAMISSFVLFLVFTGTLPPLGHHMNKGNSGPSALVVHMKYQYSESVFNLILVPRSATAASKQEQILLWTDESSKTELLRGIDNRTTGSAAGVFSWNATPALAEAMLIIERSDPIAWDVSVSYADAPTLEDRMITFDIEGECQFKGEINMHPGQTIHLDDLADYGSCSAQKSLGS